jgi:hypothetical protein
MSDYNRFTDLGFEGFRRLARDESLSQYQKIGFPNSYREGYEDLIFGDIRAKLTNLTNEQQTILDIGPGCSELPLKLIDLCREQNHHLILIDSAEMLDQLPNESFITKLAGFYPTDCAALFKDYLGKVNVILTYSVIHYVFVETSVFSFLDKSLELLAPSGQMLIGDIPNISKRKRFFSSVAGIAFHQAFMKTDEEPVVEYNTVEDGKIDDAVVLSLLLRCRNAGFDSYLLPQASALPMANRREDILITRP